MCRFEELAFLRYPKTAKIETSAASDSRVTAG